MSPVLIRSLMGAALTAGLFWMWRRSGERRTLARQSPGRGRASTSTRGTVIYSNSPTTAPDGDLGAGI